MILGRNFLPYNKEKMLLLPANEVWGKVICLQAGAWSRGVPGPGGCLVREGVPGPGGAWSRRVPGPGGVPALGGLAWGWGLVRGVWSGGCLVETPPDGYCCRQYAGSILECILVFPNVNPVRTKEK